MLHDSIQFQQAYTKFPTRSADNGMQHLAMGEDRHVVSRPTLPSVASSAGQLDRVEIRALGAQLAAHGFLPRNNGARGGPCLIRRLTCP